MKSTIPYTDIAYMKNLHGLSHVGEDSGVMVAHEWNEQQSREKV